MGGAFSGNPDIRKLTLGRGVLTISDMSLAVGEEKKVLCRHLDLAIKRGEKIAIIGENCVGKSTLANKIVEKLSAKIFSGKDYLRLEKNPSAAMETFKATLQASVDGDNIIYIITEKEHIQLLPEGAFKIVLTAELDVIKARFKERMRGNLPAPVNLKLSQTVAPTGKINLAVVPLSPQNASA